MIRALILASLIALPAAAQDLDRAALSARLLAEGVALQDPVLVFAAARLRQAAGFPPRGPVPMGWQDMLDAAAALAEGDDALQGLIADAAAEAVKGVSTGPVYRLDRLEAGGVQVLEAVEVAAGSRAEVYAEPQGQADLNLTVRDGAGALVCADSHPDPIAYCAWTPAEAGPVTVEVTNAGPDSAPYALLTN